MAVRIWFDNRRHISCFGGQQGSTFALVNKGERACRNLGLRVLELRRGHGWTQQELADRMEMDARDLRRIEAGDNVTVMTLVRLAEALDIEVGALFEPAQDGARRRPGRPKKPET